jgi:D-sedoheptulose 7-phosphate isomerase
MQASNIVFAEEAACDTGLIGDDEHEVARAIESPNILAALRKAREQGLVTVGFTGTRGESMRSVCDHLFVAPSDDTPVVQQIHMTAGHAICDQVERAMTGGAAAR